MKQVSIFWVLHAKSLTWLKIEAASKQVSQFEPAMTKYRPDWDPQNVASLKEEYRKHHEKKDGHYVESFRYATEFNQK